MFEHVQENQKYCVIFHNEIYIKKILLYHRGKNFGRLADNPTALAKTMLGVMIFYLNGGSKVLSKLVSISRLQKDFLYEQINLTNQCVELAGTTVKAIICDGNRINQASFKMFKTVSGKPRLTLDGKYLFFDFVHLLKNIRSLWMTEKTGELIFYDNRLAKIAKWAVLKSFLNWKAKAL